MSDKMKDIIEKSQEYLKEIADKLEDQYEDLSEEAAEVWQTAKPKLKALNQSLTKAAEAMKTQTDEARLQTHLAIMDASDQWTYLNKTVSELTRNARAKGTGEFEHAELQAHLAKMEARDFINKHSKEITREYHEAKEKIEKNSLKAAKEIEHGLETIGKNWVNK